MQCLMNFDLTKVAQVVGAVTKALSVDDKKEAILVSVAMSCSWFCELISFNSAMNRWVVLWGPPSNPWFLKEIAPVSKLHRFCFLFLTKEESLVREKGLLWKYDQPLIQSYRWWDPLLRAHNQFQNFVTSVAEHGPYLKLSSRSSRISIRRSLLSLSGWPPSWEARFFRAMFEIMI